MKKKFLASSLLVGATLLVGLASSSVTLPSSYIAPTTQTFECPIEEPCDESYELTEDEAAASIQAGEDEAWAAYDYYNLQLPVTDYSMTVSYRYTTEGSVSELPQTFFKIADPTNTNRWYVFQSQVLYTA